jgi:acyl-CoA synthetase (AMP-forming)/AMP-acid ligase II
VIVSPVPVQYREHEIAMIVKRTGARHVILSSRAGKVSLVELWSASGLTQVDLLDVVAEPTGLASSAVLQALQQHLEQQAIDANEIFTICWTSGTEATPKGVPRSHNEWLIGGRSVAEAAGLMPGAQMLICFPFVNMAGLSSSLIAWLVSGGTLHHHHPFDLEVFLDQLRNHPMDYTVAAPAVLNMLIRSPEKLAGIDFKRLKQIGSGGSAVAPWLMRTYAETLGVEIINYFGSNEGAALTANANEIPDPEDRARFFPRWGVKGFHWTMSNAARIQTRLVDLDTGLDIEQPGTIGELRFKGPTLLSEYFAAPEQTARAFDTQGFYCTGDLFEIAGDRGQFYRYAGRHKDIVIRGGMNISCEEVEQLLLAAPWVREVAVVGWPDELMGERVCAVVVPQPGAQVVLDDLVKHLRDEGQVAAFKWPERLIVLDALPRNPLGKVLKRELRTQLKMMEAIA